MFLIFFKLFEGGDLLLQHCTSAGSNSSQWLRLTFAGIIFDDELFGPRGLRGHTALAAEFGDVAALEIIRFGGSANGTDVPTTTQMTGPNKFVVPIAGPVAGRTLDKVVRICFGILHHLKNLHSLEVVKLAVAVGRCLRWLWGRRGWLLSLGILLCVIISLSQKIEKNK